MGSSEEYGRAKHPFVEQRHDALVELCRRHRLRWLDLVRSGPEASPLRFLVELDDQEPQAYADAYFHLLEDLEDLLGHSVHLVVESAVTNPYYREILERTRSRLYVA